MELTGNTKEENDLYKFIKEEVPNSWMAQFAANEIRNEQLK